MVVMVALKSRGDAVALLTKVSKYKLINDPIETTRE